MQQRTFILSAFTLSTAMALGTAATAADLPKEGTYNTEYYSYGTSRSGWVKAPAGFPSGPAPCTTS